MQRLLSVFLVLAVLTLTAGQVLGAPSYYDNPVAPAPEHSEQVAEAAGVPAITFQTAQWASRAVEIRTSFFPGIAGERLVALHRNADGVWGDATGLSAGDGSRLGLGIWFMPFYSTNSVWGMDAGNGNRSGYTSGTGGGSLGVDYLFKNILVGLSFTGGTGYSTSRGDLARTHAQMNFWGLTAYSSVYLGDFSLGLDVGYNSNYSNSKMDAFNVESDSQSTTWTAGVRGNYFYRTDFVDIIPHVAVRFTGSTTYKYTVNQNGAPLTNVDAANQSNWTFPVGVKFAKTVKTEGGWSLTPSLDLYVTPAAGDLHVRGRSTLVAAPNTVTESRSQIMDAMTYSASAGFAVATGAFSAGLNYTFDAAAHRAGHNIGLSLRYDF